MSNIHSGFNKIVCPAFGLFSLVSLCIALSGCGASVSAGKGAAASKGSFTASPVTVDFGSVNVGSSANNTVSLVNSSADPVVVSNLTISGNSSFSVTGTQLPLTLAPGSTTNVKVDYNPTSTSGDSGNLTITSNSAVVPAATVKLHGQGAKNGGSSPSLSAVSCTNNSITGAGTDACTVTLSGAAPAGGVNVALASNNAAVTVPGSISVLANATSAGFQATVAAVNSAQSVTLAASANGVAKNFAIQLSPAGASTLSINATSISFGNVVVNTPSTQSLTLTATGTSAITISVGSVTGSGFSLNGAKFPMTVSPGTPATLSLQFDPSATGAATGQLTIANNSSNNANAVISLNGTGINHQVALSWNAPGGSSDPISGYNVYRATSGSSSYQKLNASADGQSTYTDTSAQSGSTYAYYVTTVDSTGAESTPSNTATVAVP